MKIIFRLSSAATSNFPNFAHSRGKPFFPLLLPPFPGYTFNERGGFTFRDFVDDRYSIEEGGVFTNGGLSEIPFVELRNDSTKIAEPYVRKNYGVGPDLPVNDIKSNYFVIIKKTNDSIPKELNIVGREIFVFEKDREQPIARMAYAVSRNDRRFCGKSRKNQFSELDFVFRALNLIH